MIPPFTPFGKTHTAAADTDIPDNERVCFGLTA